ncbi:ABC transporter ATP-binding protein [Microvirga lotononidis]|uniref:ABC-type cobalamin/Fe3+-siderophore transport system, ATPase component n=1 Tax=Microvirga lotononidis TaxID=864069 RepID=I4Z1T4_9HYPH|nr:ABC transporter ATP-binding protein [Microvirga lotononidis]EIM30176.1 ABC-type cobalamin/Fe3+-siderophore transport system, ATPase component [Microvirga lotononidis]WQO31598.1 ABC transporter ATP-binding protein [Microvirga lotononidis]
MNSTASHTHSPTGAGGFTLESVRFHVGDVPILHPISTRIGGGEVVGLVGPNGSGKSTLLKLLARQSAPSGGRISFEGRALADWESRDLARRIAYLPQYPQTGSELVVRKVVALGRYPWHGPFGRFTETDRVRTMEAMEVTGTGALANRHLEMLSGGERQRVWLAMLVAQDAHCLLLDEPISALDISHQIEVLSLIRSLAHEGGRSVVVVLHDVNMASRFCDRILALRGGRLVVSAGVNGFMTPETLREVYGVDMEILPHRLHPAGIAVAN